MTGSDWLQAGAAVLASIVGALVASRLPGSQQQGISINNSPGARVSAGNKVRIDNRQITEVTIQASQTSPPFANKVTKPSAAKSMEANDEWGYIVAGIAAALLIAVGYVRYRSNVNALVLTLQIFAAFTSFSALITARIRSVRFSRGITTQIVINIALAVLAILTGQWLSNPPFAYSPSFQQFLIDGAHLPLSELITKYGINSIFFIVYQIMGLLFSVLTVVFITLHSLKVFLATSVIARQRVDPAYVPGKTREFLLTRLYGGTTTPFVLAIVTTILSLLLISGLGYTLANKNLPSLPSPVNPTPTSPATSIPSAPS